MDDPSSEHIREHYRCRKCREVLFYTDSLATPEDEPESACYESQTFVEFDKAPDWIQQRIVENNFTKGRLNCPKCRCRLGCFDFVTPCKCDCSKHIIPNIRITNIRIDLIQRPAMRPLIPPRHTPTPAETRTRSNSDSDDDTQFFVEQLTELASMASNYLDGKPMEAYSDIADAISSVFIPSSEDDNGDEGAMELAAGDQNTKLPGLESEEESGSPEQQLRRRRKKRRRRMRGQGDGDKDEEVRDSDEGEARVETRASDTAVECKNTFEELEEAQLIPSATIEDEAMPEEKDNEVSANTEDDQYTCSVCLDIYYQPHTCSPCKHCFCGPCLRRLKSNSPHETRCPLCREVIAHCSPDHNLGEFVQKRYPDEYRARKRTEKKSKAQLPGKPHVLLSRIQRHRRTIRNNFLIQGAGVCCVVLCIAMAAAVFVTTVAFVLWFILEVAAGACLDILVATNDLFDKAWKFLIVALLEGQINPEMAKLLLGSVGQLMHVLAQAKNATFKPKLPEDDVLFEDNGDGTMNATMSFSDFQRYTTADIANYTLLMMAISYFIYRVAKHMQNRQLQEQRDRFLGANLIR